MQKFCKSIFFNVTKNYFKKMRIWLFINYYIWQTCGGPRSNRRLYSPQADGDVQCPSPGIIQLLITTLNIILMERTMEDDVIDLGLFQWFNCFQFLESKCHRIFSVLFMANNENEIEAHLLPDAGTG